MEFGPVERIRSTPRFQHSRLGTALRNGEIDTFRKAPLEQPRPTEEEQQFLDELAAEGIVMAHTGEVLDFTDTAVAAREAEGLDDELEALEVREEATVTSSKGHRNLPPPAVPESLHLEPGTFTVDDVLDITDEQPNEAEEAAETDHDTAFAEGIQVLFDELTAAYAETEVAATPEVIETVPPIDVEEPVLVVGGVNKNFFGRLKDKVRGKYRSTEKAPNPNRRRSIGYAVAAVAVAGIATIGVFAARSSGDTESVSTGAPEPAASTTDTTAENSPSGSTTTVSVRGYVPGSAAQTMDTPTTTSTTTPEAQVSDEGVPGAISMTREQYDLMGTKQFVDFATTLRANPNITADEFADLVAFAELVEQNQAQS